MSDQFSLIQKPPPVTQDPLALATLFIVPSRPPKDRPPGRRRAGPPERHGHHGPPVSDTGRHHHEAWGEGHGLALLVRREQSPKTAAQGGGRQNPHQWRECGGRQRGYRRGGAVGVEEVRGALALHGAAGEGRSCAVRLEKVGAFWAEKYAELLRFTVRLEKVGSLHFGRHPGRRSTRLCCCYTVSRLEKVGLVSYIVAAMEKIGAVALYGGEGRVVAFWSAAVRLWRAWSGTTRCGAGHDACGASSVGRVLHR